jgi:predicted extracellular nuclease
MDTSWEVIRTPQNRVGDDHISVGIFYRPDKLQASGTPETLTSHEFQGLSRVPLAQVFTDSKSGESFLVVVNHLKSKGSCPDDGPNANRNDGQGCWNPARTRAATAMSRWTQSLARELTKGKALVLGDMNAYRMENPITAIIEAGFKDLTASGAVGLEFSYVFRGEAGTLDYAFASSQLLPHVRSTRILNINSPYPAGVELPKPWLRSSDHDPVLVDLRFRHSATLD